jgi:aminoacrylate hydrolase
LFLYPPAWISENIESIQKQEQFQIQNFPPHENVLRRLSALMNFQLSEEIRAALQNIPMHLIANQDDFLVPYQRSQNLKGLFPHAQLTLLKQGAHAATVTETVLMNKEMLGFLTGQESLV